MSTITTIQSTDVISNSRTDINTNFSNLNTDKIETSVLDTDTTLAANSDSKVATQKATKAYVDANVNPTGRSWNEYAADSVGTDAYAITLSSVTAYATGMTFKFKAGTANTGACSLKVNSLSAITIKKNVTEDLSTGDILANQIVTVTYDGTNMQLLDRSGIVEDSDITPLTTAKLLTVGTLDNAQVKTYFNTHLLFNLWTGSTSGALTTDFPNWIRNSSDVYVPPMGMMADFKSTGADYIWLGTSTGFFDTSASGILQYDWNKTIILDWFAKLPASGTGDINMGFGYDNTGCLTSVYNDSTYTKVMFTQRGSTGVIYATTSNNGVGVTNTDVSSGITVTNWNNYRIELQLGTEARFYINGVLKATLSGANLENGNITMTLGFGRSDTSLFQATAPNLSLQLI